MQFPDYDETNINTAALLNTYLYLDYPFSQNGRCIRDILFSMKALPQYGSPGGKYYDSWKLLSDAAESSFGSMILDHQSESMGFTKQSGACTFTDPYTHDIYVVYRGTGDGEWPDNGVGLISESTPQQEEALAYFDRLAESGCLDTQGNVYISGHSKGGNKAQFTALSTAYSEIISQCISFDGQGFSKEARHRFESRLGQDEYTHRISKLISICGNNDFVNVLGHTVIPANQTFYIETSPGIQNPAGYHDIKYLFYRTAEDGSLAFFTTLNAAAEGQGSLACYASQLSKLIMALPEEKRSDCAMALTKMIELGGRHKIGLHENPLTLEEVLGFIHHGFPLLFSSLLLTPEGQRAFLELSLFMPVVQTGAMLWRIASLLDPIVSQTSRLFPGQTLAPGKHRGYMYSQTIFINHTLCFALTGSFDFMIDRLIQMHRHLCSIRLSRLKTCQIHLCLLERQLFSIIEYMKCARDLLNTILILYKQTEQTCCQPLLHA